MLSLIVLVQEHAEAAAEGGLPPTFSVNPGLIIWTWVVFLALFFALKKYAFPSIVRLTEERERKIAKQLEAAEKANTEAQTALAEHKKLLEGAKGEAQALLTEAKVVAEKEREAMLAKARDEQQALLDRAKREIGAERDRAVAELRKEAVDLSLAAAGKLIGQRLDAPGDRAIVEQYLRSIPGETT